MGPEKAAFLFPDAPPTANLDDPDVRKALQPDPGPDGPDDTPDLRASRRVVSGLIADQIANEDPPEVWATAQRLLAGGLGRDHVLRQMTIAYIPVLQQQIDGNDDLDGYDYADSLNALPLPAHETVADTVIAVLRERQPIDNDELISLANAVLKLPDNVVFRRFVKEIVDDLLDDDLLDFVGESSVIEPGSLCDGVRLTHRLTKDERAGSFLALGVDLFGFAAHEAILSPDGALLGTDYLEAGDEDLLIWTGPDGWLEKYPIGAVICAQMTKDQIQLQLLDKEPSHSQNTVEHLREAYDSAQEDPPYPIETSELFLEIVAAHRSAFKNPQPPISELIADAGLELRGSEVAHESQMWEVARKVKQAGRVFRFFENERDRDDVLALLRLFNGGEWDETGPMRTALATFVRKPAIADDIVAEMLGWVERPREGEIEQAPNVEEFGKRLLAFARRPEEVAVSRWLMAMAAELAGDLAGAEAQLHLAVANGGGWPVAVDRLAWYLSDKGDAPGALHLWHSLGYTTDDPEVRNLERFAREPRAKVGRNDQCWCGSGRKFKTCHLGRLELPSLCDRVPWILNKAVNFLGRNRARTGADIRSVAVARAGDAALTGGSAAALGDPLVLDLVFTEGGWWQRFVTERGPVLPDDEAILVSSWLLVDRTIYEVVSVQAGTGLTVKDLRTAEDIDVREQTFSVDAAPGMLVCGRAVPDGTSHQFVGGLFPVRTGEEASLLDLLDTGDPEGVARWAAAKDRPPVLVTREGEPMVICKTTLLAPSSAVARRVLDQHYEQSQGDRGTWHELMALDSDENIVRATLRLQARRVTIDTMSEARMDRVVDLITSEIPDLEVVSSQRQPLDLAGGALPTPWPPASGVVASSAEGLRPVGPGPSHDDPGIPAEVIQQLQERFELRWCDEAVPALRGLTPRQAAAEPAGREALERLLAEFERMDRNNPAGGVVMRPARLRQILGLA
jgi:SEC-C motif